MVIKLKEGFEPNAGEITITNVNESKLVKFAVEAANSLLTDSEYTWHMKLGYDDDNYYELVLGVDDENYVCMKWAYIPKNSGMNEYGYDYMCPYDEKTGDVWDTEESLAECGEDDSVDEAFVASAVRFAIKDFKKYVEMHNKEVANEGFNCRRINSKKKTNEITESNAKYKEVKVLQGYFGGWEDLEEADADNYNDVKELKDDLKSYQENDPRSYRIITRKVENTDYDASKARKSSAKGFAVIVDKVQRGRSQGTEVYYTDDSTINRAYLEKQGYISYLPKFGVTLYDDGYSFIQNNILKTI